MLTILEAAQFVRLRVQSNAFDYCQHIKPVEHNQIVKAILMMGSFYSSTGSTTNPLENLLGYSNKFWSWKCAANPKISVWYISSLCICLVTQGWILQIFHYITQNLSGFLVFQNQKPLKKNSIWTKNMKTSVCEDKSKETNLSKC